jgi:hypothetical protein
VRSSGLAEGLRLPLTFPVLIPGAKYIIRWPREDLTDPRRTPARTHQRKWAQHQVGVDPRRPRHRAAGAHRHPGRRDHPEGNGQRPPRRATHQGGQGRPGATRHQSPLRPPGTIRHPLRRRRPDRTHPGPVRTGPDAMSFDRCGPRPISSRIRGGVCESSWRGGMDETPSTRASLLVRLRGPRGERAWPEPVDIDTPTRPGGCSGRSPRRSTGSTRGARRRPGR